MKIPIENLLKEEHSYYRLVLLAARRATELTEGRPALLKVKSRKLAVNALEEIAAGKIHCEVKKPKETKKPAKSKKS